MELAYWFMPLGIVLLVGAAFAAMRAKHWSLGRWLLRKRSSKPIAHAHRLTHLPSYIRKVRRLKISMLSMLVLVFVGMAASLALAGRYSSVTVEQPEVRNRDIVLCLDASGSMFDSDAKITKVFSELTTQFKGQRISTVLFNSSSVVYFPLVDDYNFARDQLDMLTTAFEDPYSSESYSNLGYVWSGTASRDGSSLVGDGLASCIMRFGDTQSTRARSVILATDNYVYGEQVVSLGQATNLAKQRGVRVYGINPYDYALISGTRSTEAQEMHDLLLDTGGDYYKMDDSNIVSEVVDKINAQEATRFKGSPVIVIHDSPGIFIAVCFGVILAAIGVSWRYRI